MRPVAQRIRGLSLVSLGLFTGLWELSCNMGWINPVLLSAPSAIARTGWEGLASGRWNEDFAVTLHAFAIGFFVASVFGTLFGVLMGVSRACHDILNPFVVAANALPKVVLCPLVMIWFGTGITARVFLAAVVAVFPILTSTVTGVQSIGRHLVEMARVYGASRRKMFWDVFLPSIAPFVVSGMRVGANQALIGVLVMEMFSSSSGVGFRVLMYSQNFLIESFFFLFLLIIAFALSLSGSLRVLEARLGRWRHAAY